MANITRTTAIDHDNQFTLVIDDIEIEIVHAALRAYRQKLISELDDLLHIDANEDNPDVANTREWIDRTAQLKSDLGMT